MCDRHLAIPYCLLGHGMPHRELPVEHKPESCRAWQTNMYLKAPCRNAGAVLSVVVAVATDYSVCMPRRHAFAKDALLIDLFLAATCQG